jgi:hypothetical protein
MGLSVRGKDVVYVLDQEFITAIRRMTARIGGLFMGGFLYLEEIGQGRATAATPLNFDFNKLFYF